MGSRLPSLELATADGQTFDLNKAVAKQPAVIVFYRGGWCMYCNRQLEGLRHIEKDLLELGFQLIAISPDRPEKLRASLDEHGLKYRLLSDSAMAAARALGVAFRVDAATVAKYRDEYGIDLEAASGETHHQLPVPSVWIVARDGAIDYSYVHPDYAKRIDPSLLLQAARSVAQAGSAAQP
jgi:peroxiredoxin